MNAILELQELAADMTEGAELELSSTFSQHCTHVAE